MVKQASTNLRFSFAKWLVRFAWLVFAVHLPACTPARDGQAQELQAVTIGMETTAVNALIFIADNQGYFTANGLQVSIKPYPSGLAAVDGMLKNEVDIAVASEFVLVGKTFAGEPVLTLGSIDKFMHNYLLARKDREIQDVSDLRGKKIGVPFKTAAEFYLGRFLDLNGLSLNAVQPVNINAADLVKALIDGEVDAVVAWQPNATIIADQLGSGVVRWPAQSDQVTYGNVVSTVTWTQEHPQAVQYFLKALVNAESFYASRPQEARTILQKSLSYEDAFMTSILKEHQFQVSLDQSMVLAMEDEARWMIGNEMVPDQQPPDFLKSIYIEGMQSVRPDSVNIIR